MPIRIVRNDITKMKVDAIVNAANSSLLGGGGVDGCIHKAAGSDLLEECRTLGGCPTGDAKITDAYDLPCKFVIHTVGPVWRDGRHGEQELLISCYETSLELAKENGCKTVAFPLISSGIYGYPKDEALEVALATISSFLYENEMMVYIVNYDKRSFEIDGQTYDEIAEYIDEMLRSGDELDLRSMTELFDESFSEMLLREIDDLDMTDVQCCKEANVSDDLVERIRSDASFRPSKATATAFAIALELPYDETQELLMKAGYALTSSSSFDLIVEYFIDIGNYDIFEINSALYAFDQDQLGE